MSLIVYQTVCFAQPGLNNKDSLHCLTTRQLNYYNALPFKIQDLQENNAYLKKENDTLKFAVTNFSLSLKSKSSELFDEKERSELCYDRLSLKDDELGRANKKIRNQKFIISFGGSGLIGLAGFLGVRNLIKK